MTYWIPFELAAQLEELTLFEFWDYLIRWFDADLPDPRLRAGCLHRGDLTPPAQAALTRMEHGQQPWALVMRQAAVSCYLHVIFRLCGMSEHELPRPQDYEVNECVTPDNLSASLSSWGHEDHPHGKKE